MLEGACGRVEELLRKAGIEASPAVVRGALILCAVLVAVVGWRWWHGGAGGGGSGEGETIAAAAPPTATAPHADRAESPLQSEPASITAHVVGAVHRPGVYRLVAGSRVQDLVAAAGGLLGSAEQSGVNLARAVSDGEQVYVPKKGQAPPPAVQPSVGAPGAGSGTGSTGGPDAVVDINHATAVELDVLPGVGMSTAQRIIDDREANGPFTSPEDLMRVSGIGPKRFEQMKPRIVAR